MKAIATFFVLAAAFTMVVGFLWSDFKFRMRLEIGFFSMRKETILWPFYYNKDEWTVLVLAFLGAATLLIISFVFGAFA